ncbi:MAG: PadR family transcriptional regulator [Oscillospiraceae bacterium]|nr:PadR family transcriptional regulator [Oscillospiraceae bacterium]MDE7279765.1 PadR family transcriptional regulator [Oscillospiraceae bacterium]
MEKGQMKKGVLELCILHVTASDELYGYEIMKRITGAFPEINESTVYAVLRRLHSDGCTESYTGETSAGPKRKYYRITAAGRERLEKMRSEWQEMLDALKSLGI